MPTTFELIYKKKRLNSDTDSINTKANTHLNVLRTLTLTTFGLSKEHFTLVYERYIRPILIYVHQAWQSDTATTHINKLKATQNIALRIATGPPQTTPKPHLHRKTPRKQTY